jgi:hypothetical protein
MANQPSWPSRRVYRRFYAMPGSSAFAFSLCALCLMLHAMPGHYAPGHQALGRWARWPLPRINWPIKALKWPDGLSAIGACLRPLYASLCGSMGIGWTDLDAQLMTHGRFGSTNFAKFGSHSPDHATTMHRRIIRQPPLRSYLTI